MSSSVVAARSALIVPFLFPAADGSASSPSARAASFLNRAVIDQKGQELTFWRQAPKQSRQTRDLEPAFLSMFSVRPDTANPATWSIELLRLTPAARERFFRRTRLEVPGAVDQTRWIEDLQIEAIDLVLFPLDVAILVIRLDWLPRGPVGLEAIAGRLDLARHLRGDRAVWRFGRPSPNMDSLSEAAREAARRASVERGAWHDQIAPPSVARALSGDRGVGLEELVRWLASDSDGDGAAIRLGSSRYAQHQTAIALDAPLADQQALRGWLLQTTGAARRHRVDPDHPTADVVIAPRPNRRLALAREGAVSISWPSSTDDPREAASNLAFERRDWPARFVGGSTLGVYLRLALHVRSQHLALQRLAERSLQTAELLSCHEALRDERMRNELVDLARLVAQFSLTVASEDLGGVTEYSRFFQGLRQILPVEAQLASTRAGVGDLLELVDTSVERSKAERDRRFQTFATDLGIIAVAFATVSGVMGANVPNLQMLVIWVASVVLAWLLGVRLLHWHQANASTSQRLDPATLKALVRPQITGSLRRRFGMVWTGRSRQTVRSARDVAGRTSSVQDTESAADD